jgi:hypothetical protein
MSRETPLLRLGTLRISRRGLQLGFDDLELGDPRLRGLESIAKLVGPASRFLVCTLRLGHQGGESLDLHLGGLDVHGCGP